MFKIYSAIANSYRKIIFSSDFRQDGASHLILQKSLLIPCARYRALLVSMILGVSSVAFAATNKTAYVIQSGSGSTATFASPATAATTLSPNQTVRFVLDTTSATQPAAGTTTNLSDLLQSGFIASSVTTPTLATGWVNAVKATPGTATTIAQWIANNNLPPALSPSVTSSIFAPIYGQNNTVANVTVTRPSTSISIGGGGDGLYPVAITQTPPAFANYPDFTNTGAAGNPVTKLVMVNHHTYGANVVCADIQTMAVCPGSPITIGDNTSSLLFSTAQIGSKLYVPVSGGSPKQLAYYCIETSGVGISSCSEIYTGTNTNTTIAAGNPQYGALGVFTDGNYLYSMTYVGTSATGVQLNKTNVSTGITTSEVVFASASGTNLALNVSGTVAVDDGNSGFYDAANQRIYFNVKNGSTYSISCVQINPTGGSTDCNSGTPIATATPTIQPGYGGSIIPIPDGTAGTYGNGVLKVCSNGGNQSGFQVTTTPLCYTPTLSGSAGTLNSAVSPNRATVMMVPGTTKIITTDFVNALNGYPSIQCWNTSTNTSCGSVVDNYWPYGSAMVDQSTQCFATFSHGGVNGTPYIELWTMNTNNTITSGCVLSAPQVVATIPDPAATHCSPAATPITWGNLTISNMPIGTGTVKFTDINGNQIGSIVSINKTTSPSTQTIAIEPGQFTYAQYKTFKVVIQYTGSTTMSAASQNMTVNVTHNTSDGSGPQICFDATMPSSCPTGTTSSPPTSSLNQFSTNGGLTSGPTYLTTSTASTTQVSCVLPPTVAIKKTVAPSAYQKVGTFNFTVTGATAISPASGTTATTDTISTSATAYTAVAGQNVFTGTVATDVSFVETSNTATFANGATASTPAAATPVSMSCTDSNAANSGTTAFTTITASPWKLPASYMKAGAVWACNFVNNNLPRFSVQKKSVGGVGAFGFTLGGVQ